ncbi:MAG: GAF domain-containing protein [Chloroflexi bacterium]|nr:GAF domain-containing protein [Chloroflexota bacterium]
MRTPDLESLFAASADLGSSPDWETLYPKILKMALALVNATSGSVMLVEESSQRLAIAASENLPPAVVNETQTRIGEGVAGWVALHRQPLLLIGPIDSKQYPKSFPKPDQIASSLCVPILDHSNPNVPELLGIINLARSIGMPPLTANDLRLITAFATHAAIAIENARAYNQIRRRATQSQHLIEVSRDIAKSLDVDDVLTSIMERAVELLSAESGSLFLVDEQTGELEFQVVVGPASQKLLHTRLPAGVGIVGLTAQEGKPYIVNNAQTDPRHYNQVDNDTTLVTHSLLSVPLIDKERVIGVIEVLNKKDGTLFDGADCDILTAFAIQSAIVLNNAKLYSELRRSFAETVRIIANAVEARDPYTAGHTNRVTQIALAIASELNWTREQMEILEIGAYLHDIGKIGVSDAILRKPDHLTLEEYNEMKKHPVLGAQMLRGISALKPMLPYVLYHQERYDGKGYPFGLKSDEIPIEGRLLAVADTFDAMTSNRPYRAGLSQAQAIEEIVSRRGTQFDPDIVDSLLSACSKGIIQPIIE